MSGAHIAVINDDPVFLDLMAEILGDEGYQATLHHGGPAVYPALKRDVPDLIVLDLRMRTPDDGWELLQVLRLDRALAAVPVIVCSGDVHFLREHADQLRAKGCDTLAKPFDLPELLAKVAAELAGRAGAQPGTPQS
ncbi:MAG TPA: response regulator [Thermomicrobiales bacterium]|jgi:DNA-binding response OmpR family regulator